MENEYFIVNWSIADMHAMGCETGMIIFCIKMQFDVRPHKSSQDEVYIMAPGRGVSIQSMIQGGIQIGFDAKNWHFVHTYICGGTPVKILI